MKTGKSIDERKHQIALAFAQGKTTHETNPNDFMQDYNLMINYLCSLEEEEKTTGTTVVFEKPEDASETRI